MSTYSEQLASWFLKLGLEDIPDDVVESTKFRVLDRLDTSSQDSNDSAKPSIRLPSSSNPYHVRRLGPSEPGRRCPEDTTSPRCARGPGFGRNSQLGGRCRGGYGASGGDQCEVQQAASRWFAGGLGPLRDGIGCDIGDGAQRNRKLLRLENVALQS